MILLSGKVGYRRLYELHQVKIWWSSFFFGLVTVGTARAILAMLGRDAGQGCPLRWVSHSLSSDVDGRASCVLFYRDGNGGILPDTYGLGTACSRHQPMYDGTSEPPPGSA